MDFTTSIYPFTFVSIGGREALKCLELQAGMLVNQLLLHRIAYIIRMVPYDCILHYIHVHTLEKIQDSCGLKTSVEFRSRNGVMNCRSTVPMVPGRCEEKYRGAAVPCENHMRKSIHGGCRVASPFEAAVTAKDAELLR